jgi:hypothetical protein
MAPTRPFVLVLKDLNFPVEAIKRHPLDGPVCLKGDQRSQRESAPLPFFSEAKQSGVVPLCQGRQSPLDREAHFNVPVQIENDEAKRSRTQEPIGRPGRRDAIGNSKYRQGLDIDSRLRKVRGEKSRIPYPNPCGGLSPTLSLEDKGGCRGERGRCSSVRKLGKTP